MQSHTASDTRNGTTKQQAPVEGAKGSDDSSSRGSKREEEEKESSGEGRQSSGGAFGGLKKGFLLAGADRPPEKALRGRHEGQKAGGTGGGTSVRARSKKTAELDSSKEMEVIRPKGGEDARKKRGRGLELPEVQEAMRESLSPLASQGEYQL